MLTSNFIILPLMEVSMKSGEGQKYAPGDTVLEQLEKEAREARKGLWADPVLIPP